MSSSSTSSTSSPQTSTTAVNATTAAADGFHGSNLIVNYIPPSFKEQDLHALFAPHGEINHVKVVYRKDTAESLTYGFVKFERIEDAHSAINALNGLEIYGKKMKVSFARPSDPEIKNSKIFITRLPRSYTTEDIRQLFQECGEIIECRLLVDQEGMSRQLGFVQFATHAEAEYAIRRFTGIIPTGGELSLVIKYALQPKGSPQMTIPSHGSPQQQYQQQDQQQQQSEDTSKQPVYALPSPDISASQGVRGGRTALQPHTPSLYPLPHPSVAIQWLPQPLPSPPYWASHPTHHSSNYDMYSSMTSVHSSLPAPQLSPAPSPYIHPLVVAPSIPNTTSISSNYAAVSLSHSLSSLTYPTFFAVCVSPVPATFDILSFPFLKDYGQIVEGKLESITLPGTPSSHSNSFYEMSHSGESTPSNASSHSSASPHHFSYSSYYTPRHRLIYQIRIESFERAQLIFRLHGTTFSFNGYIMTIDIRIH